MRLVELVDDSDIHSFLEQYGWYLMAVVAVGAYLYHTYLRPVIKAREAGEQLRRQKKFDEQAEEANRVRMETVRMRMQEELNAEVEARKQREVEALRERLANELEEEGAGKGNEGGPHPVRTDPLQFVRETVASHKVVMFSKSWCAFSRRAKQALSTFRLGTGELLVVELDELGDKAWADRIQLVLAELTGSGKTPRVFVNGECIGGDEETVKASRDGVMEALLRN